MSCKAKLPPILQQCALIDGMYAQFPPSFRAPRPILEKRHHGPHHSSFHMPKIDLHVPINKHNLLYYSTQKHGSSRKLSCLESPKKEALKIDSLNTLKLRSVSTY